MLDAGLPRYCMFFKDSPNRDDAQGEAPQNRQSAVHFLAPATRPYYSKDKFIEAKINENKLQIWMQV